MRPLALTCSLLLSLAASVPTLALAADSPPAAASAQGTAWPSPKALRVAKAGLNIDGRLDEALWQRAPVHEQFRQFEPTVQEQPGWRTTVQVIADDEALVVGIRAYDERPEEIRTSLTRRDHVRRDQDFVSVVIDPAGHRQSAQFFRVSASGVVADGLFTASDDGEDFSPDFDVQAAAAQLPDGYSVELRIPLSSLRYPFHEGLPWRLMVVRSIPRDSAHLLLSAPLNRESLSFIAEMPVLEGLDDLVAQVRDRRFFSVRPEWTVRSVRLRDEAGLETRERKLSLGTELKWRPRADWVLDATLNPDFSQVELDTPQLSGNTRFALYVPEKRAFFLESLDVVGQLQPDESGIARAAATFYSRTVSDPSWGLRATWRGTHGEATAMQLQDRGGGLVLRPSAYGTQSHAQPDSSTATFFRGKGRWELGEVPVGLAVLGSQRDYGHGAYNRVLGTDWQWQWGSQDAFRGHALTSSTTAAFDGHDQLLAAPARTGHNVWLSWRHKGERDNHAVSVDEISPEFANDNGFVPQSGLRRVRWDWHRRQEWSSLAPLGEWSRVPVYEMQWQLGLQESQAMADMRPGMAPVRAGEVLERRVHPGLWLMSGLRTEVWAYMGLDQQRAKAGGRLHDVRYAHLGFSTNPLPWLGLLVMEAEGGQRLDVDADRVGRGARLLLEAKMKFNWPGVGALEVEPHWETSIVRGPSGDVALREQAAQLMTVLHLSARDSVRMMSQSSVFWRRPETGLPMPAGADERTRHLSVMLQHREGLNRVLSLGLNHGRQRPGLARQSEVFVKWVQGL